MNKSKIAFCVIKDLKLRQIEICKVENLKLRFSDHKFDFLYQSKPYFRLISFKFYFNIL